MGGGDKWLRYGLVLCWAVACGGRTSDQGFDEEPGGGSSAGGSSSGGSASAGNGGTGVPTPTPTPMPGPTPVPVPVGGTGPYPGGGGSYGTAGSYAIGGAFTMGGFPSGGYAAYPNGGSGVGAIGGTGGVIDDCCETHVSPGCWDPLVASCVCAEDPYCCEVMWDRECVDNVYGWGCGSCY